MYYQPNSYSYRPPVYQQSMPGYRAASAPLAMGYRGPMPNAASFIPHGSNLGSMRNLGRGTSSFLPSASSVIDMPRSIGRGLGAASSVTRRFNWSSLLNGASKTISTLNQAMPLYQQVRPMFGNVKTFFRMMQVMKSNGLNDNKDETNSETTEEKPVEKEEEIKAIDHQVIDLTTKPGEEIETVKVEEIPNQTEGRPYFSS